MRVLYSFPHTFGASGGVSTVAFQQVRGLVDAGCEVTLACTHVGRRVEELRGISETLTLGGRRVPHRTLGVRRAYAFHDRRTARLVESGRFDVIHTWPQATLATARAGRAAGIPVLREVTNTHTAHAFEVVARERRRLGLPADPGHSHTYDANLLDQEEAEFRAADYLVVPSDYARQTFVDRGFAPERLLLRPEGVDLVSFPPGPVRLERIFTAAFVGRCEPRKGLHLALDAWFASGAAEVGRLIVCGEFEPAYRALLAGQLAHSSVEERGVVADTGAVFRDSHVLLFPSLEEGSALVTYEAQASGCALLVSDAAGARCEDGRHGFVHRAGDVAALTEHLARVVANPELVMSLRGAVVAERDRLSWTVSTRALIAAYGRAQEGTVEE